MDLSIYVELEGLDSATCRALPGHFLWVCWQSTKACCHCLWPFHNATPFAAAAALSLSIFLCFFSSLTMNEGLGFVSDEEVFGLGCPFRLSFLMIPMMVSSLLRYLIIQGLPCSSHQLEEAKSSHALSNCSLVIVTLSMDIDNIALASASSCLRVVLL